MCLTENNKMNLYVAPTYKQGCGVGVAELYIFARSGGGGGFTQPIPGDGGADQLCGVPVIWRLPTDGTRGLEVRGCGRIWPDADGPVQASQARDVKDPVIQNHSCCTKESRLDQLCGDKS